MLPWISVRFHIACLPIGLSFAEDREHSLIKVNGRDEKRVSARDGVRVMKRDLRISRRSCSLSCKYPRDLCVKLDGRNLRAEVGRRFRQVFRICEVVLKVGVSIGETLARFDQLPGEVEPATVEAQGIIASALVHLSLFLDGDAKGSKEPSKSRRIGPVALRGEVAAV